MKKPLIFVILLLCFLSLSLKVYAITEITFEDPFDTAGPDINLTDYYGRHEYLDKHVHITVDMDQSGFVVSYEYPSGIIEQDSGSLRKIKGGLYQLMDSLFNANVKPPLPYWNPTKA